MFKLLVLTGLLVSGGWVEGRLSTSGRDLLFNGQKVFLSGVNIAWNSYGYDFGNGQYASNSKGTLENWLTQIANNGGNSVRIWLHVEGDNTPAYDSDGFVTGPDRTGTMIDDMRSFLDFAQSKNIIVIFTLWNGAVLRNQNTINLFWDESKLQSYIDNALKPMVEALGDHPALGAWDIMNEPEGAVYSNQQDSNPCFDTTPLAGTGAGWTGLYIPMKKAPGVDDWCWRFEPNGFNFLKAINWQTAAIKEVNPGSMVTLGSWCEYTQNDVFPQSRNYYTDACLVAAGGRELGKLDFYQMHTYAYQNQWHQNAPFKVRGSSYGLNKPLVIGEFASVCSAGEGIEGLFQYGYDSEYQGVWSWQYNAGGECSDTQGTQHAGMAKLRGQNGNGGLVNFPVV